MSTSTTPARAAAASPCKIPAAPNSPHDNWVTTPLIPRKSPERQVRRPGLLGAKHGHKVTQSLDLTKLKALEVERLGVGSVPSSPLAGNTAAFAKDTLQFAVDTSTSGFSSTDSEPQKTQIEGGADGAEDEKPKLPLQQVELGISRRGHVKGARSYSPVRHERGLSESLVGLDGDVLPSRSPRMPSPRRKPVNYSVLASESAAARLSALSIATNAATEPPLSRDTNSSSPSFDLRPLTPQRNSIVELYDREGPSRVSTPTNADASLAAPSSPSRSTASSAMTGVSSLGGLSEHVGRVQDVAELVRDLKRRRGIVLDAEHDHDGQLNWAAEALDFTQRRAKRRALRQTVARTSILVGSRAAAAPEDTTEEELELQADALDIIDRLAAGQNGRAMFLQGTILETGRNGRQRSNVEAIRCYQAAASRGHARANYRIGMQYERADDMGRARECYERGAALDDVACLCRLGEMMLLRQAGLDRDVPKARACIQLAAIGADADAPQGAFLFARMLAGEAPEFGLAEDDLKRDRAAAVHFFTQAAKLGDAAALTRLGHACEEAELDLPLDPRLSLSLYRLAAEHGDPAADMAVSKWLLGGSEDDAIAKDEAGALLHAELAASTGLASAQFAVGYFAEIGIACRQDMATARRWYALAAAQGFEEARGRLDGLSRKATLTRRDHELHVETKIHERRRTIKMNARAAGQRRHRAQMSLPSLPTHQQLNPYRGASDRDAPPTGALDSIDERASEVANELTPRARPRSNTGRLQHDAEAPASPRALPTPGSPAVRNDRTQAIMHEHRRNRSWQPPVTERQLDARQDMVDRFMLTETRQRSPERSRDAYAGHNVYRRGEEMSLGQDYDDGPAQFSPRAPPSDVATLRGRSSPRPESSVSQIPPYRMDLSFLTNGDELQPRRDRNPDQYAQFGGALLPGAQFESSGSESSSYALGRERERERERERRMPMPMPERDSPRQRPHTSDGRLYAPSQGHARGQSAHLSAHSRNASQQTALSDRDRYGHARGASTTSTATATTRSTFSLTDPGCTPPGGGAGGAAGGSGRPSTAPTSVADDADLAPPIPSSPRKVATTFAEMGIPMAPKKESECLIM